MRRWRWDGDIDYVQVEGPLDDGDEQLILAEKRLSVLHNADAYQGASSASRARTCSASVTSRCILSCRPRKIMLTSLPGDFVSIDDGTGIVHIAPAYGADDMEVGEEHDLPMFRTVVEDGCFVEQATEFRGMWFKDADQRDHPRSARPRPDVQSRGI